LHSPMPISLNSSLATSYQTDSFYPVYSRSDHSSTSISSATIATDESLRSTHASFTNESSIGG
jgi:hypothetical protein